MATEPVRCSHCQQTHAMTRCDACQAATGDQAVWFQVGSVPFELQPPGGLLNRCPVLCVPCARGGRGPINLIDLMVKPQQRYPERVETLPTAAA